ncbi:MAG TPA: DMT family transporter [Gammaproteobacteria bacterium]
MLWVFATLVAAGAQTARNAMQSSLTASLGTLGATQVRFLYGLPFAAAFLALAAALSGTRVPGPTSEFLAFTFGGASAQIAGTALLLAAMQARSFSVATAFNKTEAVQVAIFGVVLLGEHLTLVGAGAIVVATAGVVLIAAKPGLAFGTNGARPVVFGIASGACFAIASVGFRGGILELGDGAYYLRAATTLVWALAFQALVLGAWMTVFARRALLSSLALWRQSLLSGFFGAFASQFWFLGFSLTAAANVRALGLVEVVFAHVVAHRVFAQRATLREAAGMGLVVAGVALLLLTL